MKGHKVNRDELEKVLGLRIPDSAVIEVKIVAKAEKAQKADPTAPTFTGRITYEGGKLVDIKAVNTTAINLDFFKNGAMPACW